MPGNWLDPGRSTLISERMETRDYHGWRSLVLKSGTAEIVIPTEIGPRIVHCGFAGEQNLFHRVDADLGGRGEQEWRLRGGHRLWHAPEHPKRTYDPDNHAIHFTQSDDGRSLQLEAPAPDPSGILKSMHIESLGDQCFRVSHTLENHNLWPVQCTPWALTVLPANGVATIPLPPKKTHPEGLLPNQCLVTWPYTDLSLPCWKFHPECIQINGQVVQQPQKLGLTNYPGWSALWQSGGTFMKYARPPVDSPSAQPDFGSFFELFCNGNILELETLGTVATLEPGQSQSHCEYWKILRDIPPPEAPGHIGALALAAESLDF